MIKFFRRIRKQLLYQNRFSKYLIYAIGEIVLVVIGILIALSINNWNENKKDSVLEHELLTNLVATLEQNRSLITSRLRSINGYQESGKLLIGVIENKQAYHDSLKLYVHPALMNTSRTEISRLGYESIKNAGLEIIQNDTLKQSIIVFFEEDLPGLFRSLSWGNIDLVDRERFVTENFRQGFDPISKRVILSPFNPNTILHNNYLIGLIFKTHQQREYFKMEMRMHLEENNKLLEKLKNNLN